MYFSRTEADFFIFEPLGEFNRRLIRIPYSVVAEMSANS